MPEAMQGSPKLLAMVFRHNLNSFHRGWRTFQSARFLKNRGCREWVELITFWRFAFYTIEMHSLLYCETLWNKIIVLIVRGLQETNH